MLKKIGTCLLGLAVAPFYLVGIFICDMIEIFPPLFNGLIKDFYGIGERTIEEVKSWRKSN